MFLVSFHEIEWIHCWSANLKNNYGLYEYHVFLGQTYSFVKETFWNLVDNNEILKNKNVFDDV